MKGADFVKAFVLGFEVQVSSALALLALCSGKKNSARQPSLPWCWHRTAWQSCD